MASEDYPNQFYIGRHHSHKTGKTGKKAFVYDPDDLSTHAVVVGMTGSGKTGLCMDIMEEAALNNLPAILIDPKGDITNLLLHFPELLPEDFEPWVDADAARRDNKTTQQSAEETAALWKNGLADWGIESDRIQRLKDSVDDWEEHQEVLLEQIEGTVTALLGLIGLTDVDPISDPEHILLSRIIADAWSAGKDVGMGDLIMQTTNPPFKKLGFFSVDEFFPKKDRNALAMKLNSIVAAPSFQPWITGEPLDVQSLLYTEEGKPRHSIFYIAHLSETERMFIVTLLYSAIETWMRSQSGSTTLRALVYFDEIFGYLPPTANPPSKKPMLRMFKQARAFGVGMVVATQNPVDIDYKGLSNAGTWFIGRLQTERDKERLLDGLQGASDGDFDRKTADAMLSGLGKRVFLLNNVHSRGGPELFQTRWAMNYLAGPITRNRIPDLNAMAGNDGPTAQPSQQKAATRKQQSAVVESGADAPQQNKPAKKTAFDKYTTSRPAIADGVDEYYLPRQLSFSQALQRLDKATDGAELLGLAYLPGLLLQTDVLYADRKGTYSAYRRYAAFVPDPEKRTSLAFEKFSIEPFDPDNLDTLPEQDARFGSMDPLLQKERSIRSMSKKYIDFIYRQATLTLQTNKALKLTSTPDESDDDFKHRCDELADEKEDLEIDKIQTRYDKKLDSLKNKLRREERELTEDEATLSALKMETMVSYGKSLASLANTFFGGGRRRRVTGLSSALTKQRQKANAEADVQESIEEIAVLRQTLDELSNDHEQELEEIDQKWAEIAADLEPIGVSPLKKNIELEILGIAWQPHWLVRLNGRAKTLPADGLNKP